MGNGSSERLPIAGIGAIVGAIIFYFGAMRVSPAIGLVLSVLVGIFIGFQIGWKTKDQDVQANNLKCPSCGRFANVTGVRVKRCFYPENSVEILGTCDNCDKKISKVV